MKRTITCLMILLFCASTSFAQAKRGKRSAQVKPEAKGRGCAVTVRDDLVPNRTVVVVGCDWFGLGEVKSPDGNISFRPTNGGIVVFDDELRLVYTWKGCSACGGFFSRFAGTKKVGGHNALMVKLVNGPRMEDGSTAEPTVPLYFNGKEFTFGKE